MDLPSLARRRRRRRSAVWIVLPLVGAAVAAYLLLRPSGSPAPEAVPPVAPAPQAPRATNQAPLPPTQTLAPAEAALPPLAESDALARDVADTLTRQPPLADWLTNEGLIPRFVAAVDNVADGVSPRPHLGFLAPPEEFQVIQRGERVFLDPAGYARYDDVAGVFVSLDPQSSAAAYRQLRPLLEEAYRELGRGDRTFDGALRTAIARLLATPAVDGEVELEPRVVSYRFAAPALEALSPAEKHLLRMGPRNVRRIQEQLRLIAAAMGMPEFSAPPPPRG